ncbi:MAG: NlpC/P60 family protein, partial [Sphingomonadaceae bacterium]
MTFVRITGPRAAGALSPLDPRTAAWRPDLADIALADRIAVPHYAAPMLRACGASPLAMLAAPDRAATMVSELLPGEGFAVLDISGEFAWGYATFDHYVGHVAIAGLVPPPGAGRSRVLVGPGDGLALAGPTLKAPVVAPVPAGSELVIAAEDGPFAQVVEGPFAGCFLHRRHQLAPPGAAAAAADWVRLAEGFLGSPYRWGGRTRAGIDCSGLVQMAWKLAGRPARRDSDMLFADAGEDVALSSLERGDILWWPGHIGIMASPTYLLHANAHWMAVTKEPLADVLVRLAAD